MIHAEFEKGKYTKDVGYNSSVLLCCVTEETSVAFDVFFTVSKGLYSKVLKYIFISKETCSVCHAYVCCL